MVMPDLTKKERALLARLSLKLDDERLTILDNSNRYASDLSRRSAVIRADECARISAWLREKAENGDAN